MYALTLWQPYATFIALGFKEFETRSWNTNYRGPLLIHAAKRPMSGYEKLLVKNISQKFPFIGEQLKLIPEYPTGAIVCKCNVVDCIPTITFTPNNLENMVGGWTEGRYAWKFEDIEPLVIHDILGKQGLWIFPDHDIPNNSETQLLMGAKS